MVVVTVMFLLCVGGAGGAGVGGRVSGLVIVCVGGGEGGGGVGFVIVFCCW